MDYLTPKDHYSLAMAELSLHVNDKEIFSSAGKRYADGVVISGNLRQRIMRQSTYINSSFENVDFTNIGLTGSQFVKTKFSDCIFSGANLHSCNFDEVRFIGEQKTKHPIHDAGFHKSTVINSFFKNLHIQACGFTDVVFYNTTFEDCTIRTCSMENTRFIDCSFINVEMSTLNLEYSEFDNTTFINCILPFHSILTSMGLIKQLENATNTYIYSASNKDKKISINNYFELVPSFEKYYEFIGKAFPLCNIYIYQNDGQKLQKAMLSGLFKSIQQRDFRSLKFLCKLIAANNLFTINQRRVFYDDIINWISNENFSISEYHSYKLICGDLREYLINDSTTKYILNFYIKTNIDPSEKEKLVIFLTTIDDILSSCQLTDNSIELRHNSDFVAFLNVFCENMSEVSKALIMIYSSLAGVSLFASGIARAINSIQETTKKHDEHILRKLEIKSKELANEEAKINNKFLGRMKQLEYEKELLDYEKLKLEYDDLLEKTSPYKKIILDNNIKLNVSHTSKNITNPPFPEVLHYKQ